MEVHKGTRAASIGKREGDDTWRSKMVRVRGSRDLIVFESQERRYSFLQQYSDRLSAYLPQHTCPGCMWKSYALTRPWLDVSVPATLHFFFSYDLTYITLFFTLHTVYRKINSNVQLISPCSISLGQNFFVNHNIRRQKLRETTNILSPAVLLNYL